MVDNSWPLMKPLRKLENWHSSTRFAQNPLLGYSTVWCYKALDQGVARDLFRAKQVQFWVSFLRSDDIHTRSLRVIFKKKSHTVVELGKATKLNDSRKDRIRPPKCRRFWVVKTTHNEPKLVISHNNGTIDDVTVWEVIIALLGQKQFIYKSALLHCQSELLYYKRNYYR